jgi:hypothetical protein
MTIPLSIHVGDGERTSAPPGKMSTAERGPSAPPPLPPTPASENADLASADAEPAAPLRPSQAPAQSAPRASTSPPADSHAESGGLGFTSVIRHLSLRGWLRWIYSSRSDAALRVRTRGDGNGNIWCRAGEIVDADWGSLLGEAALQEMLRLATGAVTIDFDPVDRPRRILRPMRELLYALAADSTSLSELARTETPLPAFSSDTTRDQSLPSALFGAPVLHAGARRALGQAARVSRREYVTGGLVLAALVLVAFAFGRLRGSREDQQLSALEPERAQQTRSELLPPPVPGQPQTAVQEPGPAPRELPVIPFVVLEIEPANGEIWLDQALVGLGRLELAPIPDGALHELRFVAAGYQTRSMYFVGTPPSGRVLLERAVERAPQLPALDHDRSRPASDEPSDAVADDGTADGVEDGTAEGVASHLAARGAPRRRAPAPAPPLKGRERPAETAPASAKAAPGKASPQIQLIEPHTPRVQVLD